MSAKHRMGSLWGKLALSLLLGGLLAYLVKQGGVPLIPNAESLKNMNWAVVPAYVALVLLMHFVRAARWRILVQPIKPLPLREVLLVNWVGFFMIFALPLRLGEFARPLLTKMRQDISVTAGLGTVVAERVVDGLVASLCVLWGLFFTDRLPPSEPRAHVLPTYSLVVVSAFAGLTLALVLFAWKRNMASQLAERWIGRLSPVLAVKVASRLGSMAEGLGIFLSPRATCGFLGETMVYWCINVCGTWLLAWGCGVYLSPGQAVGLVGILAIGVLLPAGPGMFGSFQIAVSAALKLYLVDAVVKVQGALFVFMLYTNQFTIIVLCGVIPLYLFRIPVRALLAPQKS